jgi:arabinan endo-1,5-alpha-L-arabinosidase
MSPLRNLALSLASFSFSAAAAETYTNPVVNNDAPDPGVVWCPELGVWASTTTTGGLPAFHLRTSADLVTWEDRGFLFQKQLSWAGTDGYWAPEIHAVNGTYNVYFVARNAATGTLSIGVASSTSGTCVGPFADSGRVLVTHPTMGQIDPTFHVSRDGTKYLIFKEDGNAVGQPTPIHYAVLTDDGLSLAPGQQAAWRQTQLIREDQPWEGNLVEGPWVVQYANAYYLFYSANGYSSPDYAIGVARAPALTGPYEKFEGNPILRTGQGGKVFQGPGHCSVVQANDGNFAMVYHAWPGAARQYRAMLTDILAWAPQGANGTLWPSVGTDGSPSTTPVPVP